MSQSTSTTEVHGHGPLPVLGAVWLIAAAYLSRAPEIEPPQVSVTIIELARWGIYSLPIAIAALVWFWRQKGAPVISTIAGRDLLKALFVYIIADLAVAIATEESNSLSRAFLAQFTAVVVLMHGRDESRSVLLPRSAKDVMMGGGIAVTLLAILSAIVLVGPEAIQATKIEAQFRLARYETIEILLGVAAIPFLEEILFRFGLIGFLAPRLGRILSVIVSAAIFSAAHGQGDIFWARFAGGIMMGWLYVRTGNVFASFILHALANLGIMVVPVLWQHL